MANIRTVKFDSPNAFLEATKAWDDSFMNFCVGAVSDRIGQDATTIHLLAVYRGDDLLIVLSCGALDDNWLITITSIAEPIFSTSPDILRDAAASLVDTVYAHLPDPLVLAPILGPDNVVSAFTDAWVSLRRSRGSQTRFEPAAFASYVGYAKRASLSAAPYTPSPHVVTPATPSDLEAIIHLRIAFEEESWTWSEPHTPEEEHAILSGPVASGLVWICRVSGDSAPAGFVLVGRSTPRTIAIRNVYVVPAHRRKGVGEAMVRAVTRYYLGAGDYGSVGVPEGPPAVGIKEEVVLNVAKSNAAGLYRKVGFLLPEVDGGVHKGGIDPETGRKGWIATVFQGTEDVTVCVLT